MRNPWNKQTLTEKIYDMINNDMAIYQREIVEGESDLIFCDLINDNYQVHICSLDLLDGEPIGLSITGRCDDKEQPELEIQLNDIFDSFDLSYMIQLLKDSCDVYHSKVGEGIRALTLDRFGVSGETGRRY